VSSEVLALPKPAARTVLISRESVALAALCLLALGLRWLGITNESLWLDEATSLSLARLPLVELVTHLLKEDVHPPLYFAMLHFWIAGGDGVAYLRLLSVLTGVLTLPAVYLLGRQLFDARVGLIAAALLAISPLHIYYSQMVRNYVLFVLLVVLAFYTLLRAMQTDRWLWWCLYIVSAIASLYSHYYSVLTLFIQNVIALAFARRAGSGRPWRHWLVASTAVGAVFGVWLLNSAMLTEGVAPGWLSAASAPSVASLPSTVAQFTLGETAGQYARWARLGSYFFFTLMLVAASVERAPGGRRFRFRRQAGVWMSWAYFLIPLIAIWLVSQVKPMYALRYLMPFMVPYYLLLAAGVVALDRRWPRWLAFGLSLAFIAPGVWYTYQTPQEHDWRIVSTYVLERAQPGDVVVFNPPWYSKPFDYYAAGRVEIFQPTDALDTQQACDEAPAEHRRLWLIQPYDRHWSDPDNALYSCLAARYDQVDVSRFPPQEGGVYLFALNRSAHRDWT